MNREIKLKYMSIADSLKSVYGHHIDLVDSDEIESCQYSFFGNEIECLEYIQKLCDEGDVTVNGEPFLDFCSDLTQSAVGERLDELVSFCWFANTGKEKKDYDNRKTYPVFSGVLNYFPDAIMMLSKCSVGGQKQHNPDIPLAWDRSKSGDELDALARHLLQAGTTDSDGILHSTKVCWRALANLQKELESRGEAYLSEYNTDQEWID